MFGQYFGSGYFGDGYFGPSSGTVATRSKYYGLDKLPITFDEEKFDYYAEHLRERRRQQLHEDQIVLDVLVQAVTSGMLQ